MAVGRKRYRSPALHAPRSLAAGGPRPCPRVMRFLLSLFENVSLPESILRPSGRTRPNEHSWNDPETRVPADRVATSQSLRAPCPPPASARGGRRGENANAPI